MLDIIETRAKIEIIFNQARHDPVLRGRLLKDVKKTLDELGISVPENFSINTEYVKTIEEHIAVFEASDQGINQEKEKEKLGKDGFVQFKVGTGPTEVMGSVWYRGENCNYHPRTVNFTEKEAIKNYILSGWLPEKPFITKKHVISTFGSCFAGNIDIALRKKGFTLGSPKSTLDLTREAPDVVRFGEGLNNTFVLLQQFEWAYENKQFPYSLWYDSKKNMIEATEELRKKILCFFEDADVFIITLGLSEIWYDKITGEAAWRAIPTSKFDPERHGFRVSTVEENRDNLEKIYNLIRKYRKNATVIFTLSPVPLIATFRPVSCISANSVSKSILRVAVDELMRNHENDKNLFYWPSYEIVKEGTKTAFTDDLRHIHNSVVDYIIDTFCEYYVIEE